MITYENALFSTTVLRKHFFKDKSYQLFLFEDNLYMTDDLTKQPKYNIKINLTTTINWILENKKIVAFECEYQNKKKAFYGIKLNLLKEMIGGKVFFESIQQFYEFQIEIGHGMAGQVYKCESKYSHEYTAIKKINKNQLMKSDGAIPQLIHELSLLNQIDHPNVVKLKETYVDENSYFIVMEYINGRSLSQELESRPYGFSVNEVLKIMKELLNAVSYIHDKGMMHRDINPLNIMNGDTIKLIDLGLARKIKNQLIFPCSGTPGYMAPEIINFIKEKQYDEKADIFSLGCVLYKLLTGEHLFTTKQGKQTLYQSNKQGYYEIRKQQLHPENNTNKMDQLFILLPYMLENDPSIRLTAKVCLTLINEIENNNNQIERLIKKILIRKQLAFNTSEEMNIEKKSATGLSKIKFQSTDSISRRSVDEISIMTKKGMAQNQQKILSVHMKQH